jgi:hypothetical protein
MNKPLLTLGLLVSTTLVISCAKTDADKVGEAQACLDSATAATASLCMEKIEGLETTQSYVVRCAATFIMEGFDQPSRLTTAYGNMTNTGGASASIAVMNVLAFASGVTASNTNMAYCAKSGSKGLILLSGIANMATNIQAIGGACTTIDATCLSTAQNNTATQAAVGAAASAAYTANCTSGQTSNTQFCTQFATASAASGGDQSCMGKQLMYAYGGGSGTTTCP